MSSSINDDIAAEVVLPSPAPNMPKSIQFKFCATTAMNILRLLSDGRTVQQDIIMLNDLLNEWSVREWKDLEVFDGDDVKEYFKDNHKSTTRLIVKRLVYIVAYARVGYVSNESKLSDIITAVKQAENPSSRPVGLGASVSDKSSSDRKTVPALESFTGQDEDYFFVERENDQYSWTSWIR